VKAASNRACLRARPAQTDHAAMDAILGFRSSPDWVPPLLPPRCRPHAATRLPRPPPLRQGQGRAQPGRRARRQLGRPPWRPPPRPCPCHPCRGPCHPARAPCPCCAPCRARRPPHHRPPRRPLRPARQRRQRQRQRRRRRTRRGPCHGPCHGPCGERTGQPCTPGQPDRGGQGRPGGLPLRPASGSAWHWPCLISLGGWHDGAGWHETCQTGCCMHAPASSPLCRPPSPPRRPPAPPAPPALAILPGRQRPVVFVGGGLDLVLRQRRLVAGEAGVKLVLGQRDADDRHLGGSGRGRGRGPWASCARRGAGSGLRAGAGKRAARLQGGRRPRARRQPEQPRPGAPAKGAGWHTAHHALFEIVRSCGLCQALGRRSRNGTHPPTPPNPAPIPRHPMTPPKHRPPYRPTQAPTGNSKHRPPGA
jgi:hypothetical protein